MLAYEIYLKNKDSEARPVKSVKPIKKAYLTKNGIRLDQNVPEYYGSEKLSKTSLLQDLLTMPLNTSNAKKLNLPDQRTGSNSPNPYVELFGIFLISTKEKKITITVGKNTQFIGTLNIGSGKIEYTIAGRVSLMLDRKNYSIGSKNLFDQYVDSKIIKSDGTLNASLFKIMCDEIFKLVKKNKEMIGETKKAKTSFSIFILPSEDEIKYISSPPILSQNKFKDSFGESSSQYAYKPTQTAKFLTYDDPAFTVNCTKGSKFYENICIGDEALSKINMPSKNVFGIAGLSWLFTDIKNKVDFLQTNHGIYAQIYENYLELKRDTDKENSQIKLVCFKKNQAKLEVLFDENLTMQRMQSIFERKELQNPPHMAFEVLIQSTKNTTLWKYYLDAVRVLVTGVGLERKSLIAYLNMRLRNDIHKWIRKNPKDSLDFFTRTWFSLQCLSRTAYLVKGMHEEEEYAWKIGKIAGMYVSFKEKSKDQNNSLRDILAYSKYDRERLRFVFQKIGQGVNLAKARQEAIEDISDYIKINTPTSEISDKNAYADYSYFFYKGVFENLGGN